MTAVTQPDRIAIVGAGAFGTALAIVCAGTGRPITLWARDPGHAARLQTERRNPVHLPDCPLPDNVAVTSDIKALSAADLVLMVVPAQQSRAAAQRLAPVLKAGAHIVACAKGIEQATGAFQSDILGLELPGRPLCVLSGPGFADEIASGRPTAVTLAGPDAETAERVCHWLAVPCFRPYRSTDMRGVELGGALKNVIAIACGIVIGRGLGESARAALLTRGLAEMARLAAALGARGDTLYGLSGLGDLVLTAMSERSRNTHYGMALAGAKNIGALQASGLPLAEGVFTAPVAAKLGREHEIAMPVTEAVAAILDGALSLDEAIETLVQRPLRSE